MITIGGQEEPQQKRNFRLNARGDIIDRRTDDRLSMLCANSGVVRFMVCTSGSEHRL